MTAIFGVDEPPAATAEGVLFRPPGNAFRRSIHEADPTAVVEYDDRIVEGAQKVAWTRLTERVQGRLGQRG